jgi:hypothetical protein
MHPGAAVQVGTGNADGNIVVVQPHTKMPERDAITGALRNFGMLDDAYRATTQIIDDPEWQRYYLKELIEIIQPLVVVACGPEAMSLLSQRKIKSFGGYTGKRFKVKDLTTCVFYATINPVEYGFARAPLHLKQQGKQEWTRLEEIYSDLKTKQEQARWACD